MKAVIVDTQWGMPIMLGEKKAEWRPWAPEYRGDLLICTSQQQWPYNISGHALCVVNMAEIRPMKRRLLKKTLLQQMPRPAGYAWMFSDVRWIKPFKVKEAVRLFDVDDSKIEYIGSDMKSSEALVEYFEPLMTWSNSKIEEKEVRKWWAYLLQTYRGMKD